MKKFIILCVALFISSYTFSQRGVRIGYIDTEYILQNLSEYEDTRNQLEEKAEKWKREIEKNEILDYQQKRFGPRGDLIIQRKHLIQPIQDQIFIAIKEIAKSRKYDFIFDKSADIVMLYSDRKFDISDQILRIITRTNNRKQLDTRREKREAEEEEEIIASNLVTEDLDEVEEEDKTDSPKPEKVLSAKELREKMLQERKQKILASRKVKDSTFTKNNDN